MLFGVVSQIMVTVEFDEQTKHPLFTTIDSLWANLISKVTKSNDIEEGKYQSV